MPQLDFFSYTPVITQFGIFFFFFILFGYLTFFCFAGRAFLVRSYFPVADLFQFVGGSAYMQGVAFFLLSREYTVYRFTLFVAQRM